MHITLVLIFFVSNNDFVIPMKDANTYSQVSQGAKYGWCLEDTWPINSIQPSGK